MKYIKLTQGKFAIVDDEDFERLNQFTWCAHKRTGQEKWYAVRSNKINRYETSTEKKMERHIILDVPDGLLIDHKNGDSLDNRKENLRIATRQQNSQNKRKLKKNTTSQYKGVSRFRKGWHSSIRFGGKGISLGVFKDEKMAALAYDQKAKELFGEFACTNF